LDCSAIQEEEERKEAKGGGGEEEEKRTNEKKGKEEEEKKRKKKKSHRFIREGLVKKDVTVAGIVMQSALCDAFSRNCDCRGSVGCIRQL
jgi:hypothetical protein